MITAIQVVHSKEFLFFFLKQRSLRGTKHMIQPGKGSS